MVAVLRSVQFTRVPEGLALGSLLIGAGSYRSTALAWVAAVESTTLLGGVIGYFFLANVPTFWLGLIMGARRRRIFSIWPRTLCSEKCSSMERH